MRVTSADRRIILSISCPDQPGIVATISHFIAAHQGNIIESEQHSTDPHHGTFFWRVCFAEDSFTLDKQAFTHAFHPIAERLHLQWSVHYAHERKRAAIFVSQLDHCLIDLLWRWQSGELAMDIPCIISNHPLLASLAEMYHVPYYHFPISKDNRLHDQEQILAFLADKVDFLILARYMQILEPLFIRTYPQHIINIHHSFLPAFVGAHPYERASARGVKLVGATAHYVTDQLDEGPIIAQDVIHCNHRDTSKDLIRKGRDVERRVLAEAVRLHTEDRVLVFENKTIVF